MSTFDLIVVGAGIVGAACADAAAEAGLRVAIVEEREIGGGATAAAMGHLVALDEDPAELALAQYSQRLWEEFIDVPAAEFKRCGTLWLARDERERELANAKIARLGAVGIAAEAVDALELYRLEPALARGLAGGMRVPGDAVVYPPNVARHLVTRACGRGARIYEGRRACALEAGGVVLDDGTHLSGPALIATGCALPELLPRLPMRARKGHLVVTGRYPDFIRHQLVELGYADSAHGGSASSVAFNVQPRGTGQILIGSSREFDDPSPQVSMHMVHRMLARAFTYLPGLRPMQALRIWTGFRPTSLDGKPYLGPIPDRPDLWVAAGHEGLGITTALGSARLLVDQLLGRHCAIDPRPYLPARAMTQVAA
ncbi:MAG: FAD-dependent oxidoreductase [Steroidobacteraceae bacterium]